MIHEYAAESHVWRTDRKEIWAFRVPAEYVQVGESLFMIYRELADDHTDLYYARQKKIKRIETNPEFRVRRFHYGLFGVTPWCLDETEVYVEAEHNPFYPRGARRHDDGE